MTIPVASTFLPQTPTQWLATVLADGATRGLNTTAWQPGQMIRTVLEIMALELSKEDAIVSARAQGAFLDYAASGTYTLTDFNGNTITLPVTPDPSIPAQNPTGAPGLLDTLASGGYNVKRTQATSASGPLQVVNYSGISIGTFVAGTFHVQNAFTGATYSNQVGFTLSPSANPGGAVTAATAASPVAVTTTGAHGLITGAVVYAKGLVVTPDNFYTITVTGANTFTLSGSVGAGSYVSGGTCWTPQQITFSADVVGPFGNAGVLAVNQLVTAAPMCSSGNLVSWSGAPYMNNTTLAAFCRAKLGALSPNGPAGAYVFYALASYLILSGQVTYPVSPTPTAAQTALAAYLTAMGQPVLTSPLPTAVTLDGGAINRAITQLNPATGTVTVVIANPNPPVLGCTNLNIVSATTAAPIVIGTGTAHHVVTGDYVQVNGILGLTGANGRWIATFVDATHVSLNTSSGAGAYTALTGQISGGDLYAVQSVLAAYTTPQSVTAFVQAAGPVACSISATVYVPASFVSAYVASMTSILTAYVLALPIGGLNVDNALNVLPIGAIEGLLYAAGVNGTQYYTRSVANVLINGSPNDLVVGNTGVVTAPVLTGVTVVGQ